ncbi:hypothetical protein LEMLEM_LOCUS5838 [Lemmus lemmus]
MLYSDDYARRKLRFRDSARFSGLCRHRVHTHTYTPTRIKIIKRNF